jgi:uncharacterized membrane protein YdjX (TVP38/TMEM64 family)
MKKPSFLILAAVAALLAIAWGSGALEAATGPATIQVRIAQAGLWGPFLFIALAVGMFALFMLSPAVWAAAAVWPLPLAFSYSFVAALLASVITYVAARKLGEDWAQDRVPASIQRWEERVRAHPFSTIIVLRILLWANPLVDLFAAVSRVPTRTYLLATVVGLVPTTAFQLLLGVGGTTIAGHLSWWGWALAAAVLVVGIIYFRKLRARRTAA